MVVNHVPIQVFSALGSARQSVLILFCWCFVADANLAIMLQLRQLIVFISWRAYWSLVHSCVAESFFVLFRCLVCIVVVVVKIYVCMSKSNVVRQICNEDVNKIIIGNSYLYQCDNRFLTNTIWPVAISILELQGQDSSYS